MARVKRPSISMRTQTSPTMSKHLVSRPMPSNLLTPPASPVRSKSSIDIPQIPMEGTQTLERNNDKFTADGVLEYPDQLCASLTVNDILGYGAWSTVYRLIVDRSQQCSNDRRPMTPPSSPNRKVCTILAVKKPTNKSAEQIIMHEAKTLTRLRSMDRTERYIASFYGVTEIGGRNAIVLACHELSLDAYIRQCVSLNQRDSKPSSEPTIGTIGLWLGFATQLVASLNWLHETAAVVHGDIKPGNILLQPYSAFAASECSFAYKPLMIDFSSSQILGSPITAGTLSAVTTEYTAPELLVSSVLRDPNSHATIASDVFSLATTLLVCATGITTVYPDPMPMRRQILAREGWNLINNTRNMIDYGRQKIPKQGVVDRALSPATTKVDNRIGTAGWLQVLRKLNKELEQ